MRRLRLVEHGRVPVNGGVHVHARLQAQRANGWSTVGICQLTKDEWNELSELCGHLGITVTHDVEPTQVSS